MTQVPIGIVRFPGTNCDQDVFDAVAAVERACPVWLWHKETDLQGAKGVVLAGGFSYGDYLRAGAIARFSPIMEEVVRFAVDGGPVLGICNGFQILTEAGLLPGALMRNDRLTFVCRPQSLKVETADTLFTRQYERGQVISFPVAHAEGNFAADPAMIDRLEDECRVVFRYVDDRGGKGLDANPNGSINDIAGVINERGNVLGLMPHPDRAMDRMLGSADGRGIFQGLVEAAA
ncbi:MAG: phosphoribosylformylglycinamidine synthase subunit PurQ [Gemmatimonadetes bacterium]|nr:phosphoribosylformylglycinamidine synthase subunit PurQ [Gemmatimonadota bacterium]